MHRNVTSKRSRRNGVRFSTNTGTARVVGLRGLRDPRRETVVGMLRSLLTLVLVTFAAGCRSDPYAEVREREWRRLEDEIYYREGIISDLEAQLESCRRENDVLRRRGGTSESSEPLPLPRNDATPDVPPDVPPEMLEDFQPPKTNLGTEAPPPLGRATPQRLRPVRLAGGVVPPAAASPSRQVSAGATPVAGSRSPAVSLEFNRRLTGGNDTDRGLGDEGILAVVEARDAAGDLVASPGPMSLALYDPLASGDHSVVARWNFTADEVAARFRDGPFGSGVHFELPWPNRPPRRPRLRVEVKCPTAGGTELAATHKFTVALPRTANMDAPAVGTSEFDSGSDAASGADDELPPWRPTRP
jgi:hypothetical protein